MFHLLSARSPGPRTALQALRLGTVCLRSRDGDRWRPAAHLPRSRARRLAGPHAEPATALSRGLGFHPRLERTDAAGGDDPRAARRIRRDTRGRWPPGRVPRCRQRHFGPRDRYWGDANDTNAAVAWAGAE